MVDGANGPRLYRHTPFAHIHHPSLYPTPSHPVAPLRGMTEVQPSLPLSMMPSRHQWWWWWG